MGTLPASHTEETSLVVLRHRVEGRRLNRNEKERRNVSSGQDVDRYRPNAPFVVTLHPKSQEQHSDVQ